MTAQLTRRAYRLASLGIASTLMLTSLGSAGPASADESSSSCTSTVTTTASSTGGGTATSTATVEGCGTTVTSTSATDGTGEASSSASVSVSTITAALPQRLRDGSADFDRAGGYSSRRGSVQVGSEGTTLSGRGPRQKMTLTLPGPTSGTPTISDGTAISDQGSYVVGQTPMQEANGGGLVVTFTMKDAASPSTFPVNVKVPGGARFKRLGESLLILDTSGKEIGMLPKPWAKDANGRAVETRYVVRGRTVTQKVFPRPDAAYPIVADPWFIPAWAVAQIIRCGFGGALGWIASAGWNWWWRAVSVVGGCLTGTR